MSEKKPAKYVAIREWLAARIASGEFARGQRLPSEHMLMDQFSVSRVTTRQALDELRAMGLIEAQRGKGYFVKQFKAEHSLERLLSFGEIMAPLGLSTSSNVIEMCEKEAERDVTKALQLSCGEKVFKIVRTRLAGGNVLSLDISYFPLDVGRELAALDLANQDIFLLMEQELGIELGYADLTMEISPVNEANARYIGTETGTPAIRIRRLTHDMDGRPLDYEYIYGRPDAFQFKARIPRY